MWEMYLAHSGVVPTGVTACVRVSVCVLKKQENRKSQQHTQPCNNNSNNIDNNNINNINDNGNSSRRAGEPADGPASVFLAFSLRVCCASVCRAGLLCALRSLCVWCVLALCAFVSGVSLVCSKNQQQTCTRACLVITPIYYYYY